MDPLRWGILSTAKIGREKVIPAIQQAEGCQVLAIASRDKDTASSVAKQLGIGVSYGSYTELLADAAIEAVYIPTPNHLHVSLAEQALMAGKHVLCEKPIGLSAAEAESLLAYQSRGLIVQEAFMVRSHPQWLYAKAQVENGSLGPLRAVHCHFSYFNNDAQNVRNQTDIGGGALYDIGCYAVHTARWMFAAEPTKVQCIIDRDPHFGTDVVTSGLLHFVTGHATFTVSTQLVAHQSVDLFGSTGRLTLTLPFNAPPDQATVIIADDGSIPGGQSQQSQTVTAADQYALQATHFARAVRGLAAPVLPLTDSIANMKIIDALFAASQAG